MLTDAELKKAIREVKATGKSKTLSDDGRRGDGRLVVLARPMPSGPLLEFYARQIAGRQRTMAKLGTYPLMTLEAAREAFRGLSPAIREGGNVRAHRDKVRRERQALGTLQDVCEGYARYMEAAGRRSAPEVRRTLIDTATSACKVIGGYRPAQEVMPADIAAWLRPRHAAAPAATRQRRTWLSAAYTWALKREHDYTIDQPHKWGITSNPAALVPAHTVAQRGGTRHLSPDEFRAVWAWMAAEGGRSDMRACNAVRLLLATGQRVEEITGLRAGQYADGWLRWDNTKTGRQQQAEKPHAIPLPRQARAIIEAMTPNARGWYVPGCKRPDEPFRGESLGYIARRCAQQLGIPQFTPRDCRRTWRTLAGDVGGLTAEECARIMNHAYGSKVEANHYDRGDNAQVKLVAMEKWERALDAILQPAQAQKSQARAGLAGDHLTVSP